MNKSKLNLIIDAILLIALLGMSGIGIMLEYFLPCGHGSGHPAYILGISKHEWGDFHWYIGLVFIVLIIVHIALHWKMIGAMCKQFKGDKKK